MFPLALLAKESIDIDNVLNSLEFLKPEILQLDEEPQNDPTTAKTERLARNSEERSRFNNFENTRIKLETKTFKEMRMEEADKKICSMQYLAPGSEGRRTLSQKFSKVKILRINFLKFGIS